jgi:hypothetical protein
MLNKRTRKEAQNELHKTMAVATLVYSWVNMDSDSKAEAIDCSSRNVAGYTLKNQIRNTAIRN